MAILNRDEFLDKIKGYIGESSDDKALSFLEDMTDTYDSMAQLSKDGSEWKTKYEENDKEWRNKYKERFYSTNDVDAENYNDHEDTGHESKPLTFEGLFNKGGK